MLLTIECSGRVLDLFTVEHPERGVTEVAAELSFPKSKAHELLASLTAVGLLRRTERGRYRLGWRLLEYNRVLADTTDFRCQALPVMQTLAGHLGEAVHLATLSGEVVVCVDRLGGRYSGERGLSPVGSTLPANSAVGQVLRAHRADAADELSEVRTRGFAIDRGQAVPGSSSVAAPIWGAEREVLAALSLSAPNERFAPSCEIYRRAVVRAAGYVSRQLRTAGQARAGDQLLAHAA